MFYCFTKAVVFDWPTDDLHKPRGDPRTCRL